MHRRFAFRKRCPNRTADAQTFATWEELFYNQKGEIEQEPKSRNMCNLGTTAYSVHSVQGRVHTCSQRRNGGVQVATQRSYVLATSTGSGLSRSSKEILRVSKGGNPAKSCSGKERHCSGTLLRASRRRLLWSCMHVSVSVFTHVDT